MSTWNGLDIAGLADLSWPPRQQLLRRLEREIRDAAARDRAIHAARAARWEGDAVDEILTARTAPRHIGIARHLDLLADTDRHRRAAQTDNITRYNARRTA